MRKLHIYGAGGCGSNLVQNVVNIPKGATGFPDTVYTLVDTSLSNITPAGKEKCNNPYIIPGLDGSGKDRKYGYKNIVGHIDKVLELHPPEDFNIVIFSLSGGSGSSAGALLMSEMIKRDIPVVGICIGSNANGIEASNTLKSVKTLQNLSVSMLKRPVVCSFYMNSSATPSSEVDQMVESDVRALALMMSGYNSGLDSKDIGHWLRYDLVTSVPGQLVDLIIHSPKSDTPELTDVNAISVVSLLPDRDSHPLEVNQPYGCFGYLPNGVIEASQNAIRAMHFIITNGQLDDRLEHLATVVANLEAAERELQEGANSTLDISDEESGFCF